MSKNTIHVPWHSYHSLNERNIMIVAIPVEEKEVGGKVCPSFGRAPYYMIYNSADQSVSYMDNEAATAAGGAGIAAAQLLVDAKVEAVATPRCGKNSAEVLSGADIKIYKTSSVELEDTMDSLSNDGLAILDSFHAGFHGHGGQ